MPIIPRMILVLDSVTALEFFRSVYPVNRMPSGFADLPSSIECAILEEDVWSLAPSFITPSFLQRIDGRLHVLAFDVQRRRKSQVHNVHSWSGRIPPESFNDCGGGVFTPSPQFVFLQCASRLDIVRLIALGDELCGSYTFCRDEKRGFRTRKVPLTSVDAIQRYLDNAQGCRGYANAMRAVRHLVDGSASPMETRDEMQLSLPFSLGGYAIKKPLMNESIELSRSAALVAKKSICRADLLWRGESPADSLIIEHQGEFDHMDSDRFNDDRARINALKMMGYTAFELTWLQVSDPYAFEQIAIKVAKWVGQRVRSSNRGLTDARRALRDTLAQWNTTYGRIC